MKWVITGILAVSGAAALAGGTMILANDDSEASAAAIQSKEGGDMPTAEATQERIMEIIITSGHTLTEENVTPEEIEAEAAHV